MSHNSRETAGPRPLVVGLGEALFDCFPDRKKLGGAPVNVCVHADALLTTLGGGAVPATRVGNDALGERFHSEIAERGVSPAYVQVDPKRPTGRVDVTLDDEGHASYEFETDSAWDALEFDETWQSLATQAGAVAFGTLAQRSEASRETIQKFLATATDAIRLFDVNLRQDFYSAEVVDGSLLLATAMKLSDEELETVCRLTGLEYDEQEGFGPAVHRVAEKYQLDWVALTRGAEGTTLFKDGQRHDGQPVAVENKEQGADTVGAGDACCAGLLTGMLLDWPIARTLQLANELGSFVASRSGATPPLPDALLKKVQ